MKKLITILLISTITLLSSCSNEKDLGLDINNTNSGILQQEEIKIEKLDNTTKQNNKEIIKHQDGNIYLYENGKQIDYLTSKAFKCESNDHQCKETRNEIEYTIINNKGKYGIVHKKSYGPTCIYNTFYGIDLDTNSVLLDELYNSSHCFINFESKLVGNNLIISIENNDYIVNDEKLLERGITYLGDIEKDGFILEGNNLVKEISLNDIFKQSTSNNNVETIMKLDNKYLHESLIKDGYTLNNLGNIKEYYKEVGTPPSEEFGKGFTSWKTIYIEGNKVLDFEINNWGGQNLIIKNPEIKNIIDLSQYFYPIQAIFTKGNGSKIIITDLDTIKLIDKSNGINKVIWKR